MSINNGSTRLGGEYIPPSEEEPVIPNRVQYTGHDFWLDTPVPESIRQIWETNPTSSKNSNVSYGRTVKLLGTRAPKADQDCYIHHGILYKLRNILEARNICGFIEIDKDGRMWKCKDTRGYFSYIIVTDEWTAANGSPGISVKVYSVILDRTISLNDFITKNI